MELDIIPYENCNLMSVVGRVDSLTAPRLGEMLKELFKAGNYKVVIDLEQVNYVSSAGLRVLIDAQKTCKQQGGKVALTRVPQRIYETLDLAGLTTLFYIDSDVNTCVTSM